MQRLVDNHAAAFSIPFAAPLPACVVFCISFPGKDSTKPHYLAVFAVFNHFLYFNNTGIETILNNTANCAIIFFYNIIRVAILVKIHCHRFLNNNFFSCFNRCFKHRRMEIMWCADVYNINIFIGKNFFNRIISLASVCFHCCVEFCFISITNTIKLCKFTCVYCGCVYL